MLPVGVVARALHVVVALRELVEKEYNRLHPVFAVAVALPGLAKQVQVAVPEDALTVALDAEMPVSPDEALRIAVDDRFGRLGPHGQVRAGARGRGRRRR